MTTITFQREEPHSKRGVNRRTLIAGVAFVGAQRCYVPTDKTVGPVFDRIVLATISWTISSVAAAYAREISKRFASSLSLVHVVDLSVPKSGGAASCMSGIRHLKTGNQDGVLRDMTEAGIRTMSHRLESLDPALALVQFVKELRADLVITETTAALQLGKTTMRADRKVTESYPSCPVLMIGPRVKIAPSRTRFFRNILIVGNTSADLAEETAVRLNIADDRPATIHFCQLPSVCQNCVPERCGLALMIEAAEPVSTSPSTHERMIHRPAASICDATSQILRLATKVKADLIVLQSACDLSQVANILEVIATQLLMAARCPVMTVDSN